MKEQMIKKMKPLFLRFLGDDFAQLPETVQAVHDVPAPRRWVGRAKVTRGDTLWARIIATIFGFPPQIADTPVTVTMTPQDDGELWERQFGDQRFRSFLRVENAVMTERFAPFTFTLGLHVADGQLHFPVTSGRIGPIPVPKRVLPVSVAREFEADGRFRFDVALFAPLTGALMVHYQGWLVADAEV